MSCEQCGTPLPVRSESQPGVQRRFCDRCRVLRQRDCNRRSRQRERDRLTLEPIDVADPPLRPWAYVYLAAFDLHLRSDTDEEKTATRAIMDRALRPLCRERGINPASRPKRDLIELLIADQRSHAALAA